MVDHSQKYVMIYYKPNETPSKQSFINSTKNMMQKREAQIMIWNYMNA